MIGTVLRYLAYVYFQTTAFPFVTLVINIIGSLVIGIVAAQAGKAVGFDNWRLFLATGVCGGFTTFSAFSLESIQLLHQSRNIAALAYVSCSVVLGIVAAYAGYQLAK